MKKRNKALLVLLALVLVTGLGAKMYSNITMGDNEWIGLGADAGRIAFDDQAIDEVIVKDARLGIGTGVPSAQVEIWHDVYGDSTDPNLMLDYNNMNFASFYMNSGCDLVIEATHSNSDLRLLTPANRDITFLPGAGGNVGVKGADPSYDLDVTGDIRATDDVLAGETVFVGQAEHANEEGSHMHSRADNEDGGYMFYSVSDLTTSVLLFGDRYGASACPVGPEMVLWIQWLVRDNTSGIVTEGDAVLSGIGTVLIAGSGGNTLEVEISRPVVPPPGTPPKGPVMLTEAGTHNYNLTLLMTWIKGEAD